MTQGAPRSAMAEWRRYGAVPIAAGIGYSTMGLQTYGIGPFVAPLEAEFGRPVLLNITATTWAALRSARIPLPARPDPRWGRLLASL